MRLVLCSEIYGSSKVAHTLQSRSCCTVTKINVQLNISPYAKESYRHLHHHHLIFIAPSQVDG